MTYREAKVLYDNGEYEKALNAFIEFFEYYKNNQNALYYISDCYNKLGRFAEGLNYILPKIDNVNFCHNRYSVAISSLIRGLLRNLIDETNNEIIDSEKYLEYLNLLKQLWKDSNERIYLSTYGFECRKIGNAEDYINILAKIEDVNILNDNYILNAKLWCLYEMYIKNFSLTNNINVIDYDEFLDKAKYIVANCKQNNIDNYYSNPFGLTIVKVVKILNQKSYCNYNEIINWITKLDVDSLPQNDEAQYTNSFGRECESASTREFYYYQLARAYEKIEDYNKCIEICNKALTEDIKFHYKNKLWLKARKLYCECQVAKNKTEAINNYRKIVDKNDFWFMKHKLASVYFNNNMMEEALKYNCLALDLRQEDKKLVNVIYDTIYVLEARGDIDKSREFLKEYLKIRNNYEWDIPYDIEAKAISYNISVNLSGRVDLKKLKNLANSVIATLNKHKVYRKGKVVFFTKNGFSGFIQCSGQNNIFFNKSQVVKNQDIRIGDIVEFEVRMSSKGPVAVNINIKESKDGKYTNK